MNVSHCFLVKGCSWELQCEDLEGLWKVCLAAARFWRASNGSGLAYSGSANHASGSGPLAGMFIDDQAKVNVLKASCPNYFELNIFHLSVKLRNAYVSNIITMRTSLLYHTVAIVVFWW